MARLVAVDDIPKGAKLVAVDDEDQPVPFGERLNAEIASVPRSAGVMARNALEGAGAIPGMLLSPISLIRRKMGQEVTDNPGEALADVLGLPKPASPTQRVVSEITKLAVPAGGIIGAANKGVQTASGVTRGVLETLSANPNAQLASAAGSGAAGGYVKETGGNEGAQLLASLAGGLAAPAAMGAATRLPSAAISGAKKVVEAVAPGVTQPNVTNIDLTINNLLKPSGMSMADVPANIRAQLRADVVEAQRFGELSPEALQRLVAYRSVGATPTRGNLTLNPVDITREKNLAKLGANSNDPALQSLAMRQNQNNTTLIEGLNNLGANTTDDAIAAATRVQGALGGVNDVVQGRINSLYEQARNTSGRSAQLDPAAFTGRANDLLDQALLGGKLPGDVRNLLNRAATGEMPLTVDVAEQFKTRIGELQRASNDRAERMALGLVRQALDDSPLATNQALGQGSIDAFNRARRVNRAWMNTVERTPALQAVRDGMEPDKFVQQFIIGSGSNANVMDVAQLRNLIRNNPEAMGAVRGQIAAHLKNKALNGAADEVGNFSQSAFNKELNSIGERKLSMFFRPEELATLRNLGRVASYEQVQPRGSAVNNSNTAGTALATIFDKLGNMPMLGKIPMGMQLVGQPAQNIAASINARAATNIPAALAIPRQTTPISKQVFLPGLLIGKEDEQKNRQRGLLSAP